MERGAADRKLWKQRTERVFPQYFACPSPLYSREQGERARIHTAYVNQRGDLFSLYFREETQAQRLNILCTQCIHILCTQCIHILCTQCIHRKNRLNSEELVQEFFAF